MKNLSKVLDLMKAAEIELLSLMRRDLVFMPEYCISGGAIRDTICGRDVKDIDVSVSNPDDWQVSWETYETGDFEYEEGHVTHICNTERKANGVPIQLICRSISCDPDSLEQYHALSMSNMFWYRGKLIVSSEALRDMGDFQHTANKGRWSEENFQKYVKKIQVKYPWPLRSKQ